MLHFTAEYDPSDDQPCPLDPRSRGSAIRLSWPYAGNSRRAVVAKLPSLVRNRNGAARNPHTHNARIVHVSYQDVELHYHLTRSPSKGCTRPVLELPLAWNPVNLEVGHRDLFQYFQRTASRSLATFGRDPTELGNTLIRIALASNTASATAVLQSLLALSALHRHDVSSQAVELKISALKALADASGTHIGTTDAIQHVAAGMLLCSFEIHQSSCTSGEWTCYLRGVKDVIQAAGLDNLPHDCDLAALLDWVYYHDVLARFSLRHWRREPTTYNSSASSSAAPSPSSISSTPASIRAEPSQAAPPALALIEQLSEVCDAIPDRLAPMTSANRDDYKTFIQVLDWRIRSMRVATTADDSADTPLLTELYQLAMLVYLNRATENLLNQWPRTQRQIDRAFAILAQLDSCDRQFPVFILGCEAKSDEQRAVVLDLTDRAEKGVSSRSFNHVRRLLQAIWAQDDLAEGDINYWDKLSYVIGCCRIMPTFV
ncbi:fungal-specific transcription factor domain-containing protein [Achaetomium macrosporum]|uniref:Fungal-specific transcription factor domain-containing protein n=1 Tax=Achaetomium macrosporum TaxID=79813 RepID=A0AAN7C168_9PEZI|nr:fungal-specific transcription factor domain-containing protein [Achaetomium macrosporum]